MRNRMLKIMFFLSFFFVEFIFGQNKTEQDLLAPPESINLLNKRYFSDIDGNIQMRINAWGSINKPGSHIVYDGINFSYLLSIVGGPESGADLSKIKVYREFPDDNGSTVYNVDLTKFLTKGDRSNFIEIKPNDTIIFPQKRLHSVFKFSGTINTFLNLFLILNQISKL